MNISLGWRSRLSAIAVLSALLLLLAACVPDSGDAGGGGGSQEAEPGELRFVWFTDGPDLPAIKSVVADFEKQEDVSIDFLVIPYDSLEQQLQAQIAGGQAPDVVRLADVNPFRRDLLDFSSYLDDPEGFKSDFLDKPMDVVSEEGGAIYGIPHDFTMNGPIVNVDMFKDAGIDLPAADEEPWTWEELLANARAAQEKAGAPYAIAYDRSGHRFGGMLQQYGGRYFGDDGSVALDGEGTRQAVEQFVSLHERDEAPLEVWVAAGSKYAAATDFFVNQQAPVYFAGNWMVGQFAESIKDFEWAAIPNPCEDNCGGYPGGKWVVGLEGTKQPETVAKLIEYLGSREALEKYVSESLFLPTRKDLIEEGIEYPVRQADMDVFLADIPRLEDFTYNDVYQPVFGPVADLMADQITAVIAGESDVREAIEATKEEGQKLVEEAKG